MVTLLVLGMVLLGLVRLYFLLPKETSPKSTGKKVCTLAIFLGSGGHTTEALALVNTLDFARYTRRVYIISEGDTLSAAKAKELEDKMTSFPINEPPSFTIITIPRARRVHQSFATVPFSALWSFFACLQHITFPCIDSGQVFCPDVLLLNGPGTCFVLCLAVYVNKFFGLRCPRMVYVETFARVKQLSLSGKLLRPFVDRFIVQWPDLLGDKGRGECHGWLC